MPEIYFMGSYGRSAGMYLYRPRMERARLPIMWPFGNGDMLDATYAPKKPNYRGDEEPQGRARVTLIADWTVLAFWDRSGPDKRGAINSTFVIQGTYSPDEALTLAREHFPQIFERLDFEVKLEGVGWMSRRSD